MAETTGTGETLALECRLVGELRRFLPDGDRGEGTVELRGPATIEDLLIHLELPERDLLVVGLNGTKAPHTDPLHDGDEVTIVAPMTGGAPRRPDRTGELTIRDSRVQRGDER